MGCPSFKHFWPLALVQQAQAAIVLQALCRLGGAALFRSCCPSPSSGYPFWLLALTFRSSRPAFCGRLTSPVRRQTNQRRNCDKSLAHTHRIPRHLAGDRRHDILCCHLLGWPARRRPTSMDRASSPHSRLVGGDSLSHPRCPQSLATNWQGQIDVFWQLRRQLQLHCRHWRQHEHWHFWHLPPNNSFKPNLLRSTKAMAERACHGFGSTTQVGLTQALCVGRSVGVVGFGDATTSAA